MSRLIFNVYEQRLTVSASSPIVANSYNSVSGIYNIASGWSYLSSIIAYFQLKDESTPVNFRVILAENGDFPTAPNLNFTAGTWQSWVVGEEFDKEGKLKRRITTNIVEFDVEESGIPSGIPFVIEPPSIGEQILGIANAALAKAREVENKANAGAFNGTPGKDGTPAGWGAVTASVDDRTGKPYVVVTSSGSNTAKDINFEFHNLKGAPGGGGGSGAVDSVNGQTGDVVLTAEDVGALPSSTVIPSKTSELTNDSGFITESAIPQKLPSPKALKFTGAASGSYDGSEELTVNIPSGGGGGAVDSVNGKTGAVVLTAEDVGALPSSTVIPSKTSELTNDSGFITANDVPAAPVSSVNTKTGAVVLTAEDVGALAKNADIDMNEHNLHNVSEIDLTFLSVGATIGSTENARITGTRDGKAAVVKDNTQSEYVQMRVGYPSDNNDAATKQYVLEVFNSIANGNEVLY